MSANTSMIDYYIQKIARSNSALERQAIRIFLQFYL